MSTLTSNLRAIAELLDDVELPHEPYITNSVTGVVTAHWYLMHDTDEPGQKSAAAAIIRTVGGHWDKTDRYDGQIAWQQERDGVVFHVAVTREAVCERVVTGTKKITVPAVEAQPERVETVEDVEWRCMPLLADEAVSA